MTIPIVEGFVKSNGCKIRYLAGKINDPNKPSLLFVPGIMMPAWIWNEQLEYFSKNYNVAAMEPRSQGHSDQSDEGHHAVAMAQDIRSVIEALDLKSLILVGWSIGVPQVLNYAAHFDSGRLSGLALVDGIVGTDSDLPFYPSMVDYWSQFQKDRIPNTKAFIRSLFRKPQKESYLEELTETALRTPTNTVMTLIYNYILQDFRPLLPRILIPTFIACIEGPRLDYMHNMNRSLPDSEIEIFSEAGHALFADQTENFNRSIETFIKTRVNFD